MMEFEIFEKKFALSPEDIPRFLNDLDRLMWEVLKRENRPGFLKKISGLVSLSDSYTELENLIKIFRIPADCKDIEDTVKLLKEESKEVNERDLSKEYFAIFIDKKMFSRKNYVTILAINLDGKREILGFYEWSNWNAVFEELRKRGLERAVLIVGRENKNLINAAMSSKIFKLYQVDWNEVKRTLTKGMKKEEASECRRKLEELKKIDSYEDILEMYENIFRSYERDYPHNFGKAMRMWNFYTAFLRFPKEVRSKISTISTVESLETSIKKRLKKRDKLAKLLRDPLLLAFIRVKSLEERAWKTPIPIGDWVKEWLNDNYPV